jgi:RNA-directed DNA polymerase
MDVVWKSDGSVVSSKSANKDAPEASAEWMEKRDPAKSNADQANPPRAQSRTKVGTNGLEGIREAARKDGKLKFVSLLHHADIAALRRSFYQLKKTAVVGIDGITWQEYEHHLEAKLIDLHGRIHRGEKGSSIQ